MAPGNDKGSSRGNRNPGTSRRGFASMDEEKQRAIASKGGKAAHEKGTAHKFDSTKAGKLAGLRMRKVRRTSLIPSRLVKRGVKVARLRTKEVPHTSSDSRGGARSRPKRRRSFPQAQERRKLGKQTPFSRRRFIGTASRRGTRSHKSAWLRVDGRSSIDISARCLLLAF